jgi:uncharacterized iron-regulated membrane protein
MFMMAGHLHTSSDQTGGSVMVHPRRARTWRDLWLDVHLYLGLVVGALGLTGSIFVFWQEIEEWLNPSVLTVAVPITGQAGEKGYRPLGQILAAAEQSAALESRMTQLIGPRTHEGVFAVYTELPSKAWQRIFVDPYTARVTGVRDFGAYEWVPRYFIDVLFALHFALFLGENGMILVAVAALFLLLSLITGLIVWWPLAAKWRQVFAIRRPTTPVRLNFDIHKTFSLYTCLVLGSVLLSGIWMNWNEPFVWVTQMLSPATRGPAQVPTSTPIIGQAPISVEQALAIATTHYPEGRLYVMVVPADPTGVFLVSRKDVPGLSAFWSERMVAIDQYSGEILNVRDPTSRHSAGETFLDWQWPLHSGQAFGWSGRLMVFLIGLACPVIYVTGVRMWWRKRRAKRQLPLRKT